MWNPIISHEMPPNLFKFDLDLKYNDYDYVLLHLLEYGYYRDWARSRASNPNRIVYLDNSCFELGASLDNKMLADAYHSLLPDYVFMPDVMGDGYETRERSTSFAYESKVPRANMIGVVQGNNVADVIDTYNYFDRMGIGMIAFPFMYPWAKGASSIDHAMHRVDLLATLDKMGIINKHKKHHLLGTHHPIEFTYYHNYDWIYSIDTSNPVMAAYENSAGYPMHNKPKTNLASCWDYPYNNVELMGRNIRIFRSLCGVDNK